MVINVLFGFGNRLGNDGSIHPNKFNPQMNENVFDRGKFSWSSEVYDNIFGLIAIADCAIH